jgi:hypothetical protein
MHDILFLRRFLFKIITTCGRVGNNILETVYSLLLGGSSSYMWVLKKASTSKAFEPT